MKPPSLAEAHLFRLHQTVREQVWKRLKSTSKERKKHIVVVSPYCAPLKNTAGIKKPHLSINNDLRKHHEYTLALAILFVMAPDASMSYLSHVNPDNDLAQSGEEIRLFCHNPIGRFMAE
ncbi:hypothetical protein FCL47_21175 [Desulfopila sp. IMCC35006]|uniref:hypothetical protein n=1 Tax=Desulfopila sp. IMCC35006 TaxID=2569542 RepID=UPI0010AD7395|nr:hypothetical protein [Desulfopila sp. IMCC35006]TKB23706.1 hypothetical protein FCL47_21175 [Desulfopila sp. IMCC35006]